MTVRLRAAVVLVACMALLAPPASAAGPHATSGTRSAAHWRATQECGAVSIIEIVLDDAPSTTKYLDSQTGRLSDTPSIGKALCGSAPSRVGSMATADYGSLTLYTARPDASASDANGTWGVQVTMSQASLPVASFYQLKPSIYTNAWSGTTFQASTKINTRYTCLHSKPGVSPLYLYHWSCGGHVKNTTYQTNGVMSWRFVIPGASGTATLTWFGRYRII